MRNPRHQGQSSPHADLRKVIGIHAAREVIRVRPRRIREIWYKQGGEKTQDLGFFINWATKNQVKALSKPEGELNKLAASHQGICVLVDETPTLELSDFKELNEDEKVILIAVDEVTDPQNIGAILRSAWLLGAKAVLVPKNRSAHLTPAAIKVASGGAEHVPLIVSDNLANDITYLKDIGFWSYGLDAQGRQTLWDIKFHEKVILVVGAEDKGIRSSTQKVCDELVAIPQLDNHASFNASVAASLVIYEVARQHKSP